MSDTELRQAVAMKLHATQCGCSDYVGVGDEDSTYEEMVDALLPLFAEIRAAALEEAAVIVRNNFGRSWVAWESLGHLAAAIRAAKEDKR